METATETRFGEILSWVEETGRAVGAFTCYDLLGFEAVVRTGESYRAPAISLESPSSLHGHYSSTAEFDWGRLQEVRGRAPALLYLHSASGLPEADLERAVSLGAAKFNVNTELRTAYFRRLGVDLSVKAEAVDLKGLGDGVVEAVQEVVEAKLCAFVWTREEA